RKPERRQTSRTSSWALPRRVRPSNPGMPGSVKPALLWFPLVALRKPVSFRGGSASGSGGRPGLQNRWHVLRGAFGGFDSHALPPLNPADSWFFQALHGGVHAARSMRNSRQFERHFDARQRAAEGQVVERSEVA